MPLIKDKEKIIGILNTLLKDQIRTTAHYGQEGINFLKHVSSGGVVVLLTFIGATDWASKNIYILWSLASFVCGLASIGVLIWYMYLRSFNNAEKFKQEQQNCLSGRLEVIELFSIYLKRKNETNKRATLVAILISILLLLAAAFASYGFKNEYQRAQELSKTRFARPMGTFGEFRWKEPQIAGSQL